MKRQSIIPLFVIGLILTGAISSCQDDPILPKPGLCDTCACDTCDTTDTLITTPNDTTSHDFAWTEYTIPAEASITGCWVFDDTTIWITGRDFYQWRNGSWNRVTVVGSGTTIFGFTPKDSWFLYGSILNHYDGDKFKEYRLYEDGIKLLNSDLDGSLRASWGTSSNDLFVVGEKGTIVHFDGTNWMKFPKVTEKNIKTIWGTSTNDIWAAGFSSSTALSVLLHYDGNSWTEIDVRTIGDIGYAAHALGSVFTADSSGHKVVITSGTLVWRKTDDGPWRQDSAELENRLSDGGFVGVTVKANNANDLLLAGSWGYISHWNGKSWHRYDEFFNPNSLLYGASTLHIKGNTAVVAGSKNGSWIAIGRRQK